jgi:putative hydrolase of the HAD superfamily
MSEEREAVFLDIGGVLLDLDSVGQSHRRFIAELAAEYDRDPERALEDWRETVGRYFRERRGTAFRSSMVGYGRALETAFSHEIPPEEWRPVFDRAIEASIRPREGAADVLKALSETLYVGVISDVDTREGRRILDRFGLCESLDGVTTSEEVGRTKPDPAVFASALGVAGVDPGRSLYVGDRYHNDMRGGSWAGLHTVAFGGTAASGPDGSADRDPDGVVTHRIEALSDLLTLVDPD